MNMKYMPSLKPIEVSFALVGEKMEWVRDKERINLAIQHDIPVLFVNNKIVELMNSLDLLHYIDIEKNLPLYSFTYGQWQEMKKLGITHG